MPTRSVRSMPFPTRLAVIALASIAVLMIVLHSYDHKPNKQLDRIPFPKDEIVEYVLCLVLNSMSSRPC